MIVNIKDYIPYPSRIDYSNRKNYYKHIMGIIMTKQNSIEILKSVDDYGDIWACMRGEGRNVSGVSDFLLQSFVEKKSEGRYV